ncbi:hypothetical protein ALC62_15115 [Cyphomyrmex costatus]|uniref:Uncharacterized protein n=1 Tax=Cyphomyrmex costatus TaxID=456900 RepID=A0A151I7Y4_9HYME|nr:hypothetical protein ALC62_15115 [Cyphomyrmex costatus]
MATRKYSGDRDRSDVDVGLSRMQMLARVQFVRGYWQAANKDRTGLCIPDIVCKGPTGLFIEPATNIEQLVSIRPVIAAFTQPLSYPLAKWRCDRAGKSSDVGYGYLRQRSDVACALVPRMHREERARAGNTESHVGAHKSILQSGRRGPRRALSSIDRYLNEYSSARLQEKDSCYGIKLISDNSNHTRVAFSCSYISGHKPKTTIFSLSENLRRASFSKATAERIPLRSSPAENFFVSCIYKESNYENLEVFNMQFAVNQFTITRGFPARSAIREIGAGYAFQMDRENSSGYRFAAPFRDAFKRRNELRRHVGFASETSQPVARFGLSLPLGGRLHNTAFDLSVDLLVSPVSLITFSLQEFWHCKAERLSRSIARIKRRAVGYVSRYLSYDRHSSCTSILLDTTNALSYNIDLYAKVV